MAGITGYCNKSLGLWELPFHFVFSYHRPRVQPTDDYMGIYKAIKSRVQITRLSGNKDKAAPHHRCMHGQRREQEEQDALHNLCAREQDRPQDRVRKKRCNPSASFCISLCTRGSIGRGILVHTSLKLMCETVSAGDNGEQPSMKAGAKSDSQ